MIRAEQAAGAQTSGMCPMERDDVGILRKKWTYHILQGIAESRANRFNQILRTYPGLSPRLLTIRLRELERCQFIRSSVIGRGPRRVRWDITEKGTDALPVIEGYSNFASKWAS